MPYSCPSSSCLAPHPSLLPPHHQIMIGDIPQPCLTPIHPQILKKPSTTVNFPQRHGHGWGNYSGPQQILQCPCQISHSPIHYHNHQTKLSLSALITTHLQVPEPQVLAQSQAHPKEIYLGVSSHNPRCYRYRKIMHLWAGRIPPVSPSHHSPSNLLRVYWFDICQLEFISGYLLGYSMMIFRIALCTTVVNKGFVIVWIDS